MKCPICGKELELKNKQIGTNENGDPIFNEYAICRDCRKQWNLDKQRAKKTAAKKETAKAEPTKAETPKKDAVPQSKPPKKATAPKAESSEKKPVAKEKRRPQGEASQTSPTGKKPVKRRTPQNTAADTASEKRYSNIPPEKVRTKHETAVRKGYEDMLATGAIGKPVKKKKRIDEETRTITKSPSASAADKKRPSAKPATKKPEPEIDKYEDDYYEDTPRFRVMRVILAILSLAGFGYFMYRGFTTGLSATAESGSVSGMTFVILALSLLVSALLYFIMIGTNTVFAFLLPMLFYLGGGVFAFLKRGDDLQLLIAAIAGGVLAVISLILAIMSRVGDNYDDEDDYDDAFEDDYADDYDD